MALAIRDAGSFDASTGAGGLNGSVRFELDRPENERFVPIVKQLEKAKAAIDARRRNGASVGPTSSRARPSRKARYAIPPRFLRRHPPGSNPGGSTRLATSTSSGATWTPCSRFLSASPEQIEATSWFRQNYAGVGPLTGRACTWAARTRRRSRGWFRCPRARRRAARSRGSVATRDSSPALVNLAPASTTACEARERASRVRASVREIDRKSYAPGYREKPLIKSLPRR